MRESVEDARMGLEGKRYCKLCRKPETQSECKFGPEMWSKFSIATVHPTNESYISEAGKMKGGKKDPCWKGYEMVGKKMKGGREVPNCVPKEDTCLTFTEFMAEVAAWQRKEGKNQSGGLNEKGRKSYEEQNPGSNLQAPQPEGGPRKNSFCARMGGMPGPMEDERGRPTRKALALRKWRC